MNPISLNSQKTLIYLLLFAISILAIPLGVMIFQQRLSVEVSADTPGFIQFVHNDNQKVDSSGKYFTTRDTIEVELRSPFEAP